MLRKDQLYHHSDLTNQDALATSQKVTAKKTDYLKLIKTHFNLK